VSFMINNLDRPLSGLALRAWAVMEPEQDVGADDAEAYKRPPPCDLDGKPLGVRRGQSAPARGTLRPGAPLKEQR